jgi:hypothetical protein
LLRQALRRGTRTQPDRTGPRDLRCGEQSRQSFSDAESLRLRFPETSAPIDGTFPASRLRQFAAESRTL